MIRFRSRVSGTAPVAGGVLDGVLNGAVAEIVLNESGIRAAVGQGEAASVAKHVGMGEKGQGGDFAKFLHDVVDGRAVQERALLADKEALAGRLHAGALLQPCADCPKLIAAERLRGR